MTTSRQPWHVEQAPENPSTRPGTVFVKDADGKVIGWFNDWQDAELVVNSVSDPDAVEHWMSECKFAQEECEILEKKLAKAEDDIVRLEAELSDAESHGKA